MSIIQNVLLVFFTSLYFHYVWGKGKKALLGDFFGGEEFFPNVDIFQRIKSIIEGIERRPYYLILTPNLSKSKLNIKFGTLLKWVKE